MLAGIVRMPAAMPPASSPRIDARAGKLTRVRDPDRENRPTSPEPLLHRDRRPRQAEKRSFVVAHRGSTSLSHEGKPALLWGLRSAALGRGGRRRVPALSRRRCPSTPASTRWPFHTRESRCPPL